MKKIGDLHINKKSISNSVTIAVSNEDEPLSSDYDYTASVLEVGLKPIMTMQEKYGILHRKK